MKSSNVVPKLWHYIRSFHFCHSIKNWSRSTAKKAFSLPHYGNSETRTLFLAASREMAQRAVTITPSFCREKTGTRKIGHGPIRRIIPGVDEFFLPLRYFAWLDRATFCPFPMFVLDGRNQDWYIEFENKTYDADMRFIETFFHGRLIQIIKMNQYATFELIDSYWKIIFWRYLVLKTAVIEWKMTIDLSFGIGVRSIWEKFREGQKVGNCVTPGYTFFLASFFFPFISRDVRNKFQRSVVTFSRSRARTTPKNV